MRRLAADDLELELGDGGASTVRHPTHTYAEPGDYTVSLTASNSAG